MPAAAAPSLPGLRVGRGDIVTAVAGRGITVYAQDRASRANDRNFSDVMTVAGVDPALVHELSQHHNDPVSAGPRLRQWADCEGITCPDLMHRLAEADPEDVAQLLPRLQTAAAQAFPSAGDIPANIPHDDMTGDPNRHHPPLSAGDSTMDFRATSIWTPKTVSRGLARQGPSPRDGALLKAGRPPGELRRRAPETSNPLPF